MCDFHKTIDTYIHYISCLQTVLYHTLLTCVLLFMCPPTWCCTKNIWPNTGQYHSAYWDFGKGIFAYHITILANTFLHHLICPPEPQFSMQYTISMITFSLRQWNPLDKGCFLKRHALAQSIFKVSAQQVV